MTKTLIEAKNSDLIISFGSFLDIESKTLTNEILDAIKNGSKLVYLHPILDYNLEDNFEKFINYEVKSEEGVASLLAYYLCDKSFLDQDNIDLLEDLDLGYLSAESNIGEEELEELNVLIKNSKSTLLILGQDLKTHPNYSNILKFILLAITNQKLTVIDSSKNIFTPSHETPNDVEEIIEFNGTVVYPFKNNSNTTDSKNLIGSKQFSIAAKIVDGSNIDINFNNSVEKKVFKLDDSLKGVVALMPLDDPNSPFLTGYCFKAVKIEVSR